MQEGFIVLSRKIVDSELYSKPPLYLKVWIYLLTRAQYQDYKGLKKGQLFVSIPELQDACTHYIGNRKVRPSKQQIYTILEYFRKLPETNAESYANKPMITTAKTTRGLIINIEKYSLYQDFSYYETNAENDEILIPKATPPLIATQHYKETIINIKELKDLNTSSEPAPSSNKNISLLLKDGSSYEVCDEDIAKYQEAYSNLDVVGELKRMSLWCESNISKRKTRKGISRFIVNWLSRQQKEERNKKGVTVSDYPEL